MPNGPNLPPESAERAARWAAIHDAAVPPSPAPVWTPESAPIVAPEIAGVGARFRELCEAWEHRGAPADRDPARCPVCGAVEAPGLGGRTQLVHDEARHAAATARAPGTTGHHASPVAPPRRVGTDDDEGAPTTRLPRLGLARRILGDET